MKEQNNNKEYKVVNEKDKGNIQYMYKPKEDAMKNQQKPEKVMQNNNDQFKTPSRVNSRGNESPFKKMWNVGTKNIEELKKVQTVEKIISEQRQPTSNETNDWTYDMKEYFKYRWEDIQRKKYAIESESDTDIECEMNEADKNLVANEIDGVDTELIEYAKLGALFLEIGIGAQMLNIALIAIGLSLDGTHFSPTVVTIPNGLKKKRKAFRFMNYIADKKEFIKCVESEWNHKIKGCNMYKVVQKPKRLKKPLNKLNWKNGNLTEKVAGLKKNLKEIQADVEKNPFDYDLKEKAVQVLNKYMEASNDELKLLQQKAKIKWLSEGDQNTAYFHGILKARKHKGRIESICDESGTRYDGDKVVEPFVDHFKKFLGTKYDVQPLSSVDITFGKTLSEEEANEMIRMVSDEEIKEAVFDIDSNKAFGPDGYTSGFFKKAWNSIGKEGYKMNNGVRRCALKIDIQKAYDTLNWDFLVEVLGKFGSHQIMINWIMTCVTTAKFSICVNGEAHGYFQGGKGLRQGDPISPYLFTIVIEKNAEKEDDNVRVKESFYSCQEKLLGVKSFTRSLESCPSISSNDWISIVGNLETKLEDSVRLNSPEDKKSMTEDINADWETRYAKEGNEINIIDGVMICFKEKI
ncbi:RNA-directed DNA polymerase, eukaryota, reverse transcriptase zinc-binding domain protein [Tanacetum coccineum]